MQMASDSSGDIPLLPVSASPDETYPRYDEAKPKKLSKIRKLFFSHTGLFLLLGLLLLAVVTFLLVTGLVLPGITTTATTKLPADPLARARALLKQSPLIDGYGFNCALLMIR